jgi:hypothetical protein
MDRGHSTGLRIGKEQRRAIGRAYGHSGAWIVGHKGVARCGFPHTARAAPRRDNLAPMHLMKRGDMAHAKCLAHAFPRPSG